LARFPLDNLFFVPLLSPVAIIKQTLPAIAHPKLGKLLQLLT
jgi:hypothetical protein